MHSRIHELASPLDCQAFGLRLKVIITDFITVLVTCLIAVTKYSTNTIFKRKSECGLLA